MDGGLDGVHGRWMLMLMHAFVHARMCVHFTFLGLALMEAPAYPELTLETACAIRTLLADSRALPFNLNDGAIHRSIAHQASTPFIAHA